MMYMKFVCISIIGFQIPGVSLSIYQYLRKWEYKNLNSNKNSLQIPNFNLQLAMSNITSYS